MALRGMGPTGVGVVRGETVLDLTGEGGLAGDGVRGFPLLMVGGGFAVRTLVRRLADLGSNKRTSKESPAASSMIRSGRIFASLYPPISSPSFRVFNSLSPFRRGLPALTTEAV